MGHAQIATELPVHRRPLLARLADVKERASRRRAERRAVRRMLGEREHGRRTGARI
jgi:hypothetical protein